MNDTGFRYDKLGAWIDKDPNDVLNYTLNFDVTGDSWLAGDTITGTPTWTPETGITNAGVSNTTTMATIKLSGGTVGGGSKNIYLPDGTVVPGYLVSCRIVTAGGLTKDESFRVYIREH